MTIGLAEVTFDVLGVTDDGDWEHAYDILVEELENSVDRAAHAAIEEMQRNHPYTDRTYKLTSDQFVTPDVHTRTKCVKYVDFGAYYAGFVNDGTSRSRPYPFLPQGVEAGQKMLDRCMQDAMGLFCQKLARK